MTEATGRSGAVLIGANVVAAINDFNINTQVATIPKNKMGQAFEEYEPGLASWSADVTCYWDTADTLGQGAITAGAVVTLALYPFGQASGMVYKSGSALVESISEAVPADGMITKAIQFKGSGALTESTVV